jgi:hypothetical protein
VEGEGVFLKGKLRYPDLARGVRDRVKERVRLFYHMPAALTASVHVHVIWAESWSKLDTKLTALLTSLSEMSLRCKFDDALVRTVTLHGQWVDGLTPYLTELRPTMGLVGEYWLH